MLRVLYLTCLFVAAGVSANIAIAWACAPWSPRTRGESLQTNDVDRAWWNAQAPAGVARDPVAYVEGNGPGVNEVYMWQREPDAATRTLGDNVLRIRAGWPLYSMEGRYWTDRSRGLVHGQGMFQGPILWWAQDNLWPLRPMVVGTVVNSAIYALVAAGIGALLAHQRRLSRWRRGLCVRCSHVLGASRICPECGTCSRSRHIA